MNIAVLARPDGDAAGTATYRCVRCGLRRAAATAPAAAAATSGCDGVYADLDNDGNEEALLPYHSGGTAGTLFYAVFRQTASEPVEVCRVGGEEVGVAMQDGYLVAQTFVRSGWEPNCCASGKLLTGYTLRGDVLEPVAQWQMGDTSMVRRMLSLYFSIWDQQRYPNAYTFLDDTIRAQVSFDRWRQDRQHIEPDDVEISFTPLLTTTDMLQPLGTVLTATITMTGQYTPPDGRPETRHYTGTWPIAYRPFALEYSNGHVHESYGWVILTDTLHLVTEPLPPAPPTPTPTSTPRPTRTPIPTPTTPASRITAYTFADADHGWLATDQKLWHTTDGGTTWQSQFDLPDPAEQIVFTSPQQGWIATTTGYLVTTDGGATWQPWGNVVLEAVRTKTHPFFLSEQHGFVVFWPNQSTNLLVRTTDGGQTWEQIHP